MADTALAPNLFSPGVSLVWYSLELKPLLILLSTDLLWVVHFPLPWTDSVAKVFGKMGWESWKKWDGGHRHTCSLIPPSLVMTPAVHISRTASRRPPLYLESSILVTENHLMQKWQMPTFLSFGDYFSVCYVSFPYLLILHFPHTNNLKRSLDNLG